MHCTMYYNDCSTVVSIRESGIFVQGVELEYLDTVDGTKRSIFNFYFIGYYNCSGACLRLALPRYLGRGIQTENLI